MNKTLARYQPAIILQEEQNIYCSRIYRRIICRISWDGFMGRMTLYQVYKMLKGVK